MTARRPTPTPRQNNPSVDWDSRTRPVHRLLAFAERISLALEQPVNWLVRDPRFNPLYHTGTIATFLLIVVVLTGSYLTFFYQFGYGVSYRAIGLIEANLVGRIMRAVHRYASGGLVIFTLLHAWRMLFQDRFRGPRWLAWLTGVLMTALIWIAGVTGYWLLWDQRAQLLNQVLIDALGNTPFAVSFLLQYVLGLAPESDWVFVLVILTAHVGVTALVALGYWYHIRRLRTPKYLPPTYWMLALVVLLILSALLAPVGVLPPLNPNAFPTAVPVDPIFLFFLPAAFNWDWPPVLLWGGLVALTAVIAALPWLLRDGPALPPAVIHADACTGCTLCANDCPYTAITMIELPEGSRHKYLAQVDSNLCVGCGVCVGSCEPLAISLGDAPINAVWRATAQAIEVSPQPLKIIYTCERHIAQGALTDLSGPGVHVVPLTCVGSAPPGLIEQTLLLGAKEVQVVGCPTEDCANRNGNVWMDQRLERERLPKLHRRHENAPITRRWLPPGQAAQAAKPAPSAETPTAYPTPLPTLRWPHFIPAVVLLGVVLAVQVLTNDLPYRPLPPNQALVQITMDHRASFPLLGYEMVVEPSLTADSPTTLTLTIDGEVVFSETFTPDGSSRTRALEQIVIPAGERQIQLTFFDAAHGQTFTLIDETRTFQPSETLPIALVDQAVFGDPVRGEALFRERVTGVNVGCRLCHSLEPDVVLVGPSLAGIATRAETRVPGLSAEEYIRQSILAPQAFTTPGFPLNQMVNDYPELLTEQELNDLVAFLLTLE